MHVTNKKSGNMTQLHDKYLLTSLYSKKASNVSKQADFVDIHMNKTTVHNGHVRMHLLFSLLCFSHHFRTWLFSKIMFVQADYELLLLNKESADYWGQNTNRCLQEIVEEIRTNNIF